MTLTHRLARWPVLHWAAELAAVLVILGALAVSARAVRARAMSDLPPCVAPREVPDGALSANPLRYP